MAYLIGVVALGGSLAAYAWFLMSALSDELDDDSVRPGRASALMPLAAWVALGTLGMGSASLLPTWWPLGVLGLLATALLLVPWPVARYITVPMGWPRSAYLIARLSAVKARVDPVGIAMTTAGWAICRQPRPRAADIRWLRSRPRRRPLTPGMLMGMGLAAAAQGDRDEARLFLDALPLFDQGITDPTVERLAREWLVADAAQRGAWDEVAARAGGLGATTPATRWLGAVAQRLLGHPGAPSDERLESLWKQVPGKRRTEWLQQRARAACPAEPDEVQLPDDVVQAALQAQLVLEAHPSRSALDRAAQCWDAALPEAEALALRRAEALGSNTPERAVQLLREQVGERLARAARGLGAPLPDVGVIGHTAHDLREEHLRTVELAARALQRRLASRKALPPVDEVREWLALKHLMEEAVDVVGDDVLPLLFRSVYPPCCTLSVRLYNDDGQPWVSNAMTRWLLKLAHRVGDERAVALQTKNLAAVSAS